MIETIIHLLVNTLIIIANLFLAIIIIAIAIRAYRGIRNLVAIKKLQKLYPTYGGVKVELIYRDRLPVDNDGITEGLIRRRSRVIQLALFVPCKRFVENYLHERRHSEQMFSGDTVLYSLYEEGRERINSVSIPLNRVIGSIKCH